jgi:diguanylate cyclase (GGDEF)-like protein
MKALIVEDDPTLSFMLEQSLQAHGFEPVVAADEAEARRLLLGRDPARLAIVGHAPPHRDAVALCGALRRSERGSACHFVLLAAAGEELDRHQVTEASVDDILVKPCQAIELDLCVRAARRRFDLEDRLAAAEEARRSQAMRDPLTGLLNRSAILTFLQNELARASRGNATPAILLIHVDNFAAVSEWHGTEAGDAVLVEVGHCAKTQLRVYDGLGRYGDDEFLAVLPGCQAQPALATAERIRTSVAARPIEAGGRLASVTLSIGVAPMEVCATPQADRLVAVAAAAARKASATGGNAVAPADGLTDGQGP